MSPTEPGVLVVIPPYDEVYEYVQDCHAKIQYLVDWIATRQPMQDGGFTFPDGDFWPTSVKQRGLDKSE